MWWVNADAWYAARDVHHLEIGFDIPGMGIYEADGVVLGQGFSEFWRQLQLEKQVQRPFQLLEAVAHLFELRPAQPARDRHSERARRRRHPRGPGFHNLRRAA